MHVFNESPSRSVPAQPGRPAQQDRPCGLLLNGWHSGTLTHADAFLPTDSLTVEAWATSYAMGTRQVILEKPGSYALLVDSDGQLCLRVRAGDGPVPGMIDLRCPLPEGPHHISASFSARDGLALIRIDGVEVARTTAGRDLRIGRLPSPLLLGVGSRRRFHFEGLIERLAVWSCSRASDGRQGLVANWDFTRGSGLHAPCDRNTHVFALSSDHLWMTPQPEAQAAL